MLRGVVVLASHREVVAMLQRAVVFSSQREVVMRECSLIREMQKGFRLG